MFEKNTYADLICQDIQNEYHSLPEHLWARFPNYTVFRHQDNQKWFALIMDIPKGYTSFSERLFPGLSLWSWQLDLHFAGWHGVPGRNTGPDP